MTKEAALYEFWSSFGLPAYEENSVYAMAYGIKYPYITFEVQTDQFQSELYLSASIWYRDASWAAAYDKKREIEAVLDGGHTMTIDNGAMHIKPRTPFAQNSGDPTDDMVKRIILSVFVEFWTAN